MFIILDLCKNLVSRTENIMGHILLKTGELATNVQLISASDWI